MDASTETLQAVRKELDRRFKLQKETSVDVVPVSMLAKMEDLTPDGLVKRCKRLGVSVTDKDGNPSRAGAVAYVNLTEYYHG